MLSLGLALALAAATLPAPISARDLVTVNDLSGLAASPDGRWLAFRTEQPALDRNQVTTCWYVLAVDGSAAPRRVLDGGAALHTGPGVVLNERPIWLPDSSGFLVRAAIDGAVQVWRVDVRAMRGDRVTESDGDVTAFDLVDDGRTLRFSAGPARDAVRMAEQAIRDGGARVDASVDLAVGVVGGSQGPFGPKSVRLTGEWFDRRDLMADGRRRFFRQPLGGVASSADNGPLARDYVLPDPANEAVICKVSDCRAARVEAIVPIPGATDLLVTTADAAQRQTLSRWTGKALTPIYRARGLASGSRIEYEPCAVTATRAYCVLASADRPPQLAAIDLSSGQASLLYDPNAALRAVSTDRAQPISWTDRQGHKFEAQLYLPRLSPPVGGFPLVVQYYWCEGFLRGGQGDELPFLALAEQGVAALCINRSIGSQSKPDRLADLEIAASGIRAVVDKLARSGTIDPQRVGMQGLSFGSEVTMWVARRTTLLRAASIASGRFEAASYWYYADPKRDFTTVLKEVWGLGNPEVDAKRWRAVAAAPTAGAIGVPLLMQLPESEARWSIELFRKLQRSGAAVELYAFPEAAHVKAAPRQRLAAMERNLAWFLFWLKGGILADPVDAERAERWRALARRTALDRRLP